MKSIIDYEVNEEYFVRPKSKGWLANILRLPRVQSGGSKKYLVKILISI